MSEAMRPAPLRIEIRARAGFVTFAVVFDPPAPQPARIELLAANEHVCRTHPQFYDALQDAVTKLVGDFLQHAFGQEPIFVRHPVPDSEKAN